MVDYGSGFFLVYNFMLLSTGTPYGTVVFWLIAICAMLSFYLKSKRFRAEPGTRRKVAKNPKMGLN